MLVPGSGWAAVDLPAGRESGKLLVHLLAATLRAFRFVLPGDEEFRSLMAILAGIFE